MSRARAKVPHFTKDPLSNRVFVATLASGILSGVTFLMIPGAWWIGPGILFGVATGWVFVTSKWLDAVQGFIWLIASTGAWYLAFHSYTMHINGSDSTNGSDLSNMLRAGVVGALVLALVFSLLTRKINLMAIGVTAISGLALAAVMNWILASGAGTQLNGDSSTSIVKFAAAFTVWQVGVGFSLLAYKPKQARS